MIKETVDLWDERRGDWPLNEAQQRADEEKRARMGLDEIRDDWQRVPQIEPHDCYFLETPMGMECQICGKVL